MLRFFATEVFKEISFDGKLQLHYAISNYGRLVSYTDKPADGRFVKGTTIKGYRIFRYKIRDADNKLKHRHFFYYKLVADYFLPKTSDDQIYVLHLDYNKMNDFAGNLKWATREEMLEHQQKSPHVQEARRKLVEHNKNRNGHKLTTTKVMLIKKLLANPNRKTRMKMIAKQFGISEMQLYRIKSGENWGHIKV